jgi:methylenetetrahydrofolate reductase (NADH)
MTLAEQLAAGRFVLTAEVTPPLSASRDALLAKALPLKGLADAVNVTDGAGARPHMSALTAAAMLVEAGIEPILQFTCRDRNRIALQSDLLGAAASGVRNLLALRGDDPSAGDQPETKAVFDLDARQLLQTARALRDEGTLPNGRKVDGRCDYFLGAADNPIDPPPGWKPDGLHAKIVAGGQFVQTQFCMDADVARRYVARLAEHGVSPYLLIGVAPLRSAKSARWMREKLYGTIIPDRYIERLDAAQDPQGEGVRICLEVMRELSEIPQVAGCHVMAPGRDGAVAEVLAQARRTLPRLAPAGGGKTC